MVALYIEQHDLPDKSMCFSKSVDSNLMCGLCKKLLRRPKQTNCGHRFCSDCIDQEIKLSPGAARCPVDRQELNPEEIFVDRCCEKDILNLELLCRNHEQGCNWLGQLRNSEEHTSKCEYSTMGCPNAGCTENIERRYLNDHVHNMCNYRLITCEHCKAQVSHASQEMHLTQCPKIDTQCTMGCGAVLPRGDLDKHVTEQCVNAPIPCPFEQNGCDFKGSRGDVEEHKSRAIEKHIHLVGDKNNESNEGLKKMEEKVKNLESEKEHLETQMKESREALSYAKQDLQTQQTKLGIMEKNMAKQKEDLVQLKEALENILHEKGTGSLVESQMAEIISMVESQEKRLVDLERELTQERESLGLSSFGFANNSMNSDRRLERNEHVCVQSETKLNQHDIRLQMLEATSYDGTYIWKIDEWSKRVRDARMGKTPSIYSPPFYVGRYGYKVCGRLYPCGDGIGKETHISLFFVVMKGEYDALLSWPFGQKVTFRLLDPNRLNDITDSFRPDPKSTSFQKPKSAMNVASGTPQFLSQRSLNNGGYVIDDTLFIKISVDKTGLREL